MVYPGVGEVYTHHGIPGCGRETVNPRVYPGVGERLLTSGIPGL